MFSFTLPDETVAPYAQREVPWGYTDAGGNSLGEITFLRTYSRLKPDGTKERWHEVVRRVVEGMYSLLEHHHRTHRLPWDEQAMQAEAMEAYERLFELKWTPPGRGLWMMGTPLVNELRNSAALQNCAFVSTADMTDDDPAAPLTWLMEASMLGVGVGFDTRGAKLERSIHAPEPDDGHYVIPDSREGWVESVRLLLESYFKPGRPALTFDYSQIRPAGEPIKTFGGTAAGPAPLRRLHDSIRRVLDGRGGEKLTTKDIADLGNLIGVCVVAGNVRRSAEILLGSIDDPDFLNLKNPEVFPERNSYSAEAPGWGWMSNNSVLVDTETDLAPIVSGIVRNGEPGVMWLDTTRAYGRLADPADHRDARVQGVNPCVTSDTWVMTTEGPRQVRELISRRFDALVDGKPFTTLSNGFFLTGTNRDVFDMVTDAGHRVRLTRDHKVLTAARGWVEAQRLTVEDEIVLQNHEGVSWSGRGTEAEGYSTFGMIPGHKKITDDIERTSSDFYRGFLRAAFDTDGGVEGASTASGITVRLHQSDREQLERVQRMLARLGIHSRIRNTRAESVRPMPDGAGGVADYVAHAQWRLIVSGKAVERFRERVGFADPAKAARLDSVMADMTRGFYAKPMTSRFVELMPAGSSDVYDVTVQDVHAFDANGLHVHNCGEQPLESFEMCTLVETYPSRASSKEDYLRTLYFAFLYAKTVTLLPTHWERTNAIMQRNRRIGTSASGLTDFVDSHGVEVLTEWLDEGYARLRGYDRELSERLAVRESIRVSTVKPSGTVSILAGVSPGVHWTPGGEYFNRAIRFGKDDPLVVLFRSARYRVEPASEDPEGTVVVFFPVRSTATRSEKQVSLVEKADMALLAQRYWSDNAVSNTLTFDPESEADQVGQTLQRMAGKIKSVSFLPQGNFVFPQMPYTQITAEEYEQAGAKLQPVFLDAIYDGDMEMVDAIGEAYCETDDCEFDMLELAHEDAHAGPAPQG